LTRIAAGIFPASACDPDVAKHSCPAEAVA
jgi:hypothetical protein